MADRKEPPFYNDHSIGTFHYKLPFYDTMDLFIETLTGTCFELRVSPFEAVISVKAKIQRLEGIPVAQQHLIWNSLELDDEYCLHDYGISEGCTLKLVLAMRGGPINTRRVTMEEPARDVADMMEGSREEPWEKGSASKQVTFLVYREGEQLNFFRVVDRGDGTLTPLSEALSGGSVYNVYTEEEEYGLASSAMQQGLENSVTMNKMKLLKAKMEDMNLNKKKSSKLKPRPPLGPHPTVSSLGPSSTRRQHRMLRPLPQGDQPRHVDAQLLPSRDQEPAQHPAAPSSSLFPTGRRVPPSCPNSAAAAASSSSCYMLQEEEAWETCPPFTKVRPPPKVSRLDVGGARLMRDCVYPQLPPLSTRGHPAGSLEASEHGGEALGLGLSEEASVQPAATVLGELMSEPLCLEERGLQRQLGPPASLLNPWTQLGSPPSLLPFPPGGRDPSPPFAFSAVGFPPSPPPPPRLVTADWPGEGPEAVVPADRAREEPTGPLDRPGLLASLLTRAAGGAERLCPGPGLSLVLPATSASRQGPLEPRPPSMPNSIQLLQEDLVRKVSPLHRAAACHMASKSLCFAGGASSSVRRLGTPTYHLPPVKAPMGSKKKTSKHCFLCARKTGLATSYECRCGNNFCSTHRYAETHDCSYDYKSAGRRFLQEANPIVSAPKLPKI